MTFIAHRYSSIYRSSLARNFHRVFPQDAAGKWFVRLDSGHMEALAADHLFLQRVEDGS